VAISMDKPIVGRHVFEKDILYVKVSEHDAKALLTTHLDNLAEAEQEVLKEYAEQMRKKTPFWAF
jgi:translation initiation factor 5B